MHQDFWPREDLGRVLYLTQPPLQLILAPDGAGRLDDDGLLLQAGGEGGGVRKQSAGLAGWLLGAPPPPKGG